MPDQTQLISGAAELLEDGHRRIARLRAWAANGEAVARKDPQLAADILKDIRGELARLDRWVEADVREKLLRAAGNAKKKEDDLSATVAALALRLADLSREVADLRSKAAGGEERGDGPLRLVKGG